MSWIYHKTHIILLSIVFLAAVLRFYHLDTLPPSLDWDEAAWGYNAYAFSLDGKDEFGRFLPLDYIESFGDFKPPMYAYLAVPGVLLFGLNEFTTRLPSALFGTFTVLVSYFLVLRIFTNTKNAVWYGLSTAFIVAVSPWHINLSRAGFEANVATFFIVCGVWFFLWSIQNRKWLIVLAALCFALSMCTFNTARIVSPLLVLLLTLALWRPLLQMKKEVIVAGIVGILVLLPSVQFLTSPQAKLRFDEVNIFSDITIVKNANQQIVNDNNAWWSNILHNRRVAYTLLFSQHYLDHFNPTFLFISGDVNPRLSTQDVGQLYLWDLPFFIVGIFLLFKKREGYWWIVPMWLLVGIIPAATARETPHALRIESTLPMFQIFTAIGFVAFTQKIWHLKHSIIGISSKKIILSIVGLLLMVNCIYYLHGYYTFYPVKYASEWQYGYKDMISYIQTVKSNYKNIYITQSLGRPYIYTLFYTKYSPTQFRQNAIVEREALGFVHVRSFDTFIFANEPFQMTVPDTLYIVSPLAVPPGVRIVKNFYQPNGQKVLVAYSM